jgi:hypothetical protein
MSFPKNIFKDNKKKIIVISLVFLSIAVISMSVYAVSREVGDIRSFAGPNPSCNTHNDCPPNWMYCIGGQCYSYTIGPGVGSSCTVTPEYGDTCDNALLHCINGRCQRVVGEPGGCTTSYDCVRKYKGVDDGPWSCTNGQCIKFERGAEQYWNGDEWVKYGSRAACITTNDCGPGAVCDGGGCHLQINKEPCSLYGCEALHPDPNKKYVCVDSSGEIIDKKKGTYTPEGGTCKEIDVCDPRLIVCGPGTHCKPAIHQSRRFGKCYPDEGTTAINNEPPEGWYDIKCEGGELIERCSNSTSDQRVRYCSNNPDEVIRWNGWRGANDQKCIEGGEIWGHSGQSLAERKPSDVPKDFYDPSGCPTGTRLARCSNINEGQLVSFCSTDKDNPERSVKRFDNWVGPNGETCTTEGMVLPDASVKTYKDLKPSPSLSPSNVNPKIQPPSPSNSQQSSSRADLIDLILQLFFNSKQKPQDCPGDVNKDGVVDREDFSLLADNWYSEDTLIIDTENGKTLDLDLNPNGIIDIEDVRVVIDNWGCTVK